VQPSLDVAPPLETAHEFAGLDLDLSQAAVAALYLTHESKRHCSDVGGPTSENLRGAVFL
jgi:hypothetical protein